MYINEKTFLIKGDLYTDMDFDQKLLGRNEKNVTIHVKGNIFFGVTRCPKNLKNGDYYLKYLDFISIHGPIYDLVGFSEI